MQQIIEAMRNRNIYSVLHIGCGKGEMLAIIKEEYPNVKIAGCDTDKNNIEVAKKEFARREWGEGWDKKMPSHDGKDYATRTADTINYRGPKLPNIEFKVGNPFVLPFNGASFDLVLTIGVLEKINPEWITRAMREVRRVNSRDGKVMFVEPHSKNIVKRTVNRFKGKHIYNYEKLLNDNFFKNIRIRDNIITATI